MGLEARLAIDIEPGQTGIGPRTLASAIYARLRADIISGRCGSSERLLIGPLGKRFQVSLASVREALSRLVADGLVVAEDQRGFRVSALSMQDLTDVTNTRIELECLALRRSIARGGPAWEHGLMRAWHDLESVPYVSPDDRLRHTEAWSQMHGKFHAALVAACGLDWLLRFRATLYEQSERYRRLGQAINRGNRDVRSEHARIFAACIARDAETAASELATHFQHTATAIAEAYRRRDTPETTERGQR
jgi:DNA-binding GntR family transcriptional regulator